MRTFCLLLLLISIIACDEGTKVNLISGRLFNDCLDPLPDAELALKTNVGGNFQNSFIIVTGRSSLDGSYSLSYQLDEEDIGSADILLIGKGEFKALIEKIPLNEDLDLELYQERKSLLIISLETGLQLAETDTLYYGINGFNIEQSVVQPLAGPIDTINIKLPNTINGLNNFKLYYGLGKSEFSRARDALDDVDSTFQNLPFQIMGCIDTTNLKIKIN